MFSVWLLLGILALYMGLLFFIALWGDSRNALGSNRVSRRWVYSLALAVYCTSWTFYGAVGRSADSVWSYLPIYLGPLLVYTLGIPLLRRIVDGVQHHNLTSVADFIAARYGSNRLVASVSTIICVVAIVPYIALQLHGIAIGVDVLAAIDSPPRDDGLSVSALVSAAALAIFAILFGTRHSSSRESQQGLLLAVSFESVVKLMAFVAVGVLALSQLGMPEMTKFLQAQPALTDAVLQPAFLTQTLLAAIAVLCLPRQFHVAAVEYMQPGELRLARWVFPGYLVIIAVFVLPIVALGLLKLPATSNPDSFVLLLPAALDETFITLLIFIGGVSAASAMVIVSSIALGTMITNEIVLPRVFGSASKLRPDNYVRTIKRIRRVSIVIIVALAYGYYLRTEGYGSLASTGLLAFVGIAQLAPAMLVGLFWSGATRVAAVSALIGGSLLWAWTMLLPVLAPEWSQLINASALPGWLTPSGFFGLSHVDGVSRAAWSSLSVNLALLVTVSLLTNHRPEYFRDASRFLLPGSGGAVLTLDQKSAERLIAQFFGSDEAQEIARHAEFGSTGDATYERAEYCETLLSGLMGAATARRLVAEYSRAGRESGETVLDYATQMVDFSRELLQASLQNIGVAVSVIDANQRLVAWNDQYKSLFGFPTELLRTGIPIERLVRFNAERGLLGSGDAERLIATRLERLRVGHPYRHERALPSGSYLEIRGAPMPGGGFITTFTDITAYKELQHTLEQANIGLEGRVLRRTQELRKLNSTLSDEVATRRETERALSKAKALAEQANTSKTRFLAAATHDLMQPLNSARLFSAVLAQETAGDIARTASNIEQSLESMEHMLSTLLDVSKLDAGVLPVSRRSFVADELLAKLSSSQEKAAENAGIRLTVIPSSVVINSDPNHLHRILQNFLVNALRYTGSGGRIVVGARRCRDGLRLEVWDNGPGIDKGQQELIFEEFRRGGDPNSSDHSVGPRGSGLGLSISRRLSALLGHKIALRSEPGQGSVFSVTVPRAAAAAVASGQTAPPGDKRATAQRFAGLKVLCVDNDVQVLAGMSKLLSSWGCGVTVAATADEALAECREVPDIMLIDFHLEYGVSGIDVIATLREHWGQSIPAVLITADHTEEAQQAARGGAIPLLRKPLKPAALGALMNRLTSA